MKNTFNINSCPICSNIKIQRLQYNNTHFLFLTKKNKNIFESLNILSCLECGFSYAHPFIKTELLNEFYENEYNSEGGPHFQIYNIGNHKWKNSFNTRATFQLMLAAQYIDLSKIKNYMDVGCGNGNSFRTLNKMNCDAKYFGMEGGKKFQKDLNELNVNLIDWNNDILAIDDKYNNFFDLILISHVLEHFNAQYLKSILVNINKYLKSGGVFICEVPNDDSNNFLLESTNQAPHLSFFSKKSLLKIMEDCGFDVKYINCVGEPINITSDSISASRVKLRKFIHKYSVIKKTLYLFRQIFRHILMLMKYYFSNNAIKTFSTNEFIYGDDRRSIRICVMKK